MMKPIQIAIVGLGWVGQNRHNPSLLRDKNFKLVGVIDKHEGRARAFAQQWNLPCAACSPDLQNVPWLDEVEAVTLATPPSSHAALACQALAQGKHVLTEKPFALTTQESEAMSLAAQNSGKQLAVVHNFQFSRAAQRLWRDLAQDRLGPITRVAATQLGNPQRRLPSWYETLPLGLFYDESPHFFYMLNALAKGGLSLCRAHGFKAQHARTPRLVHVLYKDQNDTPFTIDCQFDSTLSEWHVRITGTKATAIIDIFRDIYMVLPNDRQHKAYHILRSSACAITQHLMAHIPNGFLFLKGSLDYGQDQVVNRFAQSIRNNQEDDKIGLAQALKVHKLQSEAVAAITENLYA
ncbi:MAG: Gfo/Idh/MocA family oxidoreductase [Alphaproteobacteria bacterium]|nr:Gfo/Idh/MocA family oxidoreductase [Alphaproteobacteria bacterium]